MKEWKVKQEIFHRLNREHPDAYGEEDIEMMSDTSDEAIIRQVVWYFSNIPPKVIYPAKSYFVAIVYARLLRDHFAEDPYVVLDDPNLLYGNDPYFVPYSAAKAIYDRVLSQVGWNFSLTMGEIPDVAGYFSHEFMLENTN